MDIKSLAKPYEWQGAVLWYLPYKTQLANVALVGLNEIEPEAEYVNAKTGERTNEEPESLNKARAKAAETRRKHMERWAALKQEPDEAMLAQVVVKSDWQETRLWNGIQDIFWMCLPIIVAIDFPEFDENTSPELRVFSAFWQETNAPIAERWNAFRSLLGAATYQALWNGYTATRHNPAPAKPELGAAEPADPKDEGSGSESEPVTTVS